MAVRDGAGCPRGGGGGSWGGTGGGGGSWGSGGGRSRWQEQARTLLPKGRRHLSSSARAGGVELLAMGGGQVVAPLCATSVACATAREQLDARWAATVGAIAGAGERARCAKGSAGMDGCARGQHTAVSGWRSSHILSAWSA